MTTGIFIAGMSFKDSGVRIGCRKSLDPAGLFRSGDEASQV
jgi:hypothetical protein